MRPLSNLLFLLLCLTLASCNTIAEPADWVPASMADLAGEQWTPAADGVRSARGGETATFTVPVWWGDGIRPAKDSLYLLTVEYKDTADKPVIFLSHAGIRSYWGLSEVHRFGGSGDGQWKTAEIPLSWDLIMRKNVPGDITEFGIASPTDLPIRSIRMEPVTDDAERARLHEQYNRQTRAWVAKAQADVRTEADLGDEQKPVLPEAWKDKPLVPYQRTYLLPLMPAAAPQKGEAGATLSLRMAKNEYEPAAFAVYANGQDLQNVTYSVSPLRSADGKELACELDLRTAEYSAVSAGKGKYRMFPQRLWPMYPVDIPAGRSHWFWVTVHTLGEKSEPGTYRGKVMIDANGRKAALPIEVEVLPVHLLTMQEADLEMGTCVSGLCSLQELQTLAEHNHTGMDIWFGGAQPEMRVEDGKLSQDFYYLDNWMDHAVDLGMTHMMWFLGGDPYGFPDTLNLERDLYRAPPSDRDARRKEFLRLTNENPEKVIPGLRDLYVEWTRQTAEHAKQNDWPRLIIHPFDEPAKWVQNKAWENPYHRVIGAGPWIKPHFKDACALIREGAKGYPNVVTGGDIHHAKPGIVFVNDVTVFCTNAIHEDQDLGNKVRAAGTEFWQYAGCNDQAPPHRGRFSFGFYFGAYDSIGSLAWAYNTLARFDTSKTGGWGYGWYTPFGTVIHPYMPGLREGWDDRRWIATLREELGQDNPTTQAVLDTIGKQAIEMRSGRGKDTVYDFYAEIDRYGQLDEWRNTIIDTILKARQKTDPAE